MERGQPSTKCNVQCVLCLEVPLYFFAVVSVLSCQQEAQRKKKAERQVTASKAGQAAREEKVAKEAAATKAGSHKGAGTAGGGAAATGGGDLHPISTLTKSTAAKTHTSSKPPVS